MRLAGLQEISLTWHHLKLECFQNLFKLENGLQSLRQRSRTVKCRFDETNDCAADGFETTGTATLVLEDGK